MLPPFLNKERRVIFVRLTLNGMAQVAVMVTLAYLIQSVFDHWIIDQNITDTSKLSLTLMAVVFTLLIIITALLRYREKVDAEALGQSYSVEVRSLLFDHISKLNQRKLMGRSRGGMILRFMGDIGGLRQWLSLGLARLSVAGITIVGTLCALAIANWQMACFVGSVLLLGAVMSLALGKPLELAVNEARKRRGLLAGNVNEKLSVMSVVQVSGQSDRELDRMNRQSERLRQAMLKRARIIGGMRGGMVATTMGATATALFGGAWLIEQNSASAGAIVAAISIVGMLATPMTDLGRVFEYFQSAKVAKEKINRLLQEGDSIYKESDDSLCRKEVSIRGTIEFENICVSGAKPFSATVQPGKLIAIVGANGAGKSTLLAMVARLIDVQQGGQINIDGIDISKLPQSQLSNMVGVVSPDLPLLKGSMRKNLKYRQADAGRRAMKQALRRSGLEEWARDLKHSEKLRINEQGNNLSLGERHRLALARAILGQPAILLLDEVESNLDARTIALIKQLLEQRWGTILMATHALDMAVLADEIWLFKAGRLVEKGKPDEVLEGNSQIKKYFERQNKQKPIRRKHLEIVS